MIDLTIPTFHAEQAKIYRNRGRFNALRCGRRFGKTDFFKTVIGDRVAKGKTVGYFAPNYKILAEAMAELTEMLDPIKLRANANEGWFRSVSGGRVDYWTLEDERAGRSRKYHDVLIDEAAFTRPHMLKTWQTAIRPSLVDYEGNAWVGSTPNGKSPDNFFYEICTNPEHGFKEFHAPTSANPYMPAAEIALLEQNNTPLVFLQEYKAEFVDWSGVTFFNVASILNEGLPVAYPPYCDAVFCTVDTAVKTGSKNDGTAVCYWAYAKYGAVFPLILLDWDILQMEGSLLEVWMPSVFQRLDELSRVVGARGGSQGAFVEDKASGTILLQQGARRDWPMQPIDSSLTAVGKDERAVSVSGYVHRGMVKISEYAYNKTVNYKGDTRNHFLSQVFDFRLGVKDQADDILDTFCYGVAISCGDSGGH